MSKFLPSLYTIRGLRAAQGVIFKDPLSARRWMEEQGIVPAEHVKVLPAEVIYYGSNLKVDMKTTEEVVWPQGRTAGPPHDK